MGQPISTKPRDPKVENLNTEPTVESSPPDSIREPPQVSNNVASGSNINIPSSSKSYHLLPNDMEVKNYPVEIRPDLPALGEPIQASSSTEFIPPPKPDYTAPPPYEVAAQTFHNKLPSYEEVEREKHLEDDLVGVTVVNDLQLCVTPRPTLLLPGEEAAEDLDTSLLGTDFMFYTAFFVAFIFNWIGFLLLMCFCRTVASRYGAVSGFGLSLAKWTFIVQHSTELTTKENTWLWWLVMVFGLLICIRALIQYLNIKRSWALLPAGNQERLLFLY